MPKYTVCIDYSACKIFEVDANSPDAAEAEAMRQAAEVAPYDELCLSVGYVDEEQNV